MNPWKSGGRVGGGSGGAAAKVAAHLPAGYLGALAQWDCARVGSIVLGEDRSGNGFHCGNINPIALPGLLPGVCHLDPKGDGDPVSASTLSLAPTAALQLTGALTVMACVLLRGYNFQGTGGYVANCGLASGSGDASNSLWSMVTEQLGTVNSRLIYFATRTSSKTGIVAYGNSVPMNDGVKHFLCMRRDADATAVDLQVDGNNARTTGLPAPTGGSSSYVRLGGTTRPTPNELVNGVMGLVNLWNTRLTDAQVAACRAILMGL